MRPPQGISEMSGGAVPFTRWGRFNFPKDNSHGKVSIQATTCAVLSLFDPELLLPPATAAVLREETCSTAVCPGAAAECLHRHPELLLFLLPVWPGCLWGSFLAPFYPRSSQLCGVFPSRICCHSGIGSAGGELSAPCSGLGQNPLQPAASGAAQPWRLLAGIPANTWAEAPHTPRIKRVSSFKIASLHSAVGVPHICTGGCSGYRGNKDGGAVAGRNMAGEEGSAVPLRWRQEGPRCGCSPAKPQAHREQTAAVSFLFPRKCKDMNIVPPL